MHVGLGVQQFQHIPDGDAGQHAAPGGQDDRGPAQRAAAGGLRHCGIAVTQGPQPRETFRVAERRHGAGQLRVITSAGRQPRQRRADDVGADRRDQGRDQRGHRRDRLPGPAEPVAGQLPPRGSGSIGAAGQPALLPAAAVLTRQPVQQCRRAAGIAWQEASQPLGHLVAGLRGGRPPGRRRPRREPGPRRLVTRQPHRFRRARHGGSPAVTTSGSRTAQPGSRAGSPAPEPRRPAAGPGGPALVVGQYPADHVFLARCQIQLRGGQQRMTQDQLHVGERKSRVLGHPVGRGMPQRVQRRVRARRRAGPLEHPVRRVIGQRTERPPQRPPQRLPAPARQHAVHLQLIQPQPHERIIEAGSCCSSRVPLRTTVISCRPGSAPPRVADSNSEARAPVDT